MLQQTAKRRLKTMDNDEIVACMFYDIYKVMLATTMTLFGVEDEKY